MCWQLPCVVVCNRAEEVELTSEAFYCHSHILEAAGAREGDARLLWPSEMSKIVRILTILHRIFGKLLQQPFLCDEAVVPSQPKSQQDTGVGQGFWSSGWLNHFVEQIRHQGALLLIHSLNEKEMEILTFECLCDILTLRYIILMYSFFQSSLLLIPNLERKKEIPYQHYCLPGA